MLTLDLVGETELSTDDSSRWVGSVIQCDTNDGAMDEELRESRGGY